MLKLNIQLFAEDDGKIVIGTKLDTKTFDKQINYIEHKMEDIEEKLSQADKGYEIGEDTQKLEAEYERLGNHLVELKKRQEGFNEELNESSNIKLSGISEKMSNIGKSIESSIKKVVRWGLSIFGIRTAFGAVSNAMSVITSQDEQLAADIQYMKNAIAYTLEPIVRAVVNLAKQLMFYIAYIIKAWTGKNIFENANKSLKGANKSAGQLRKTLAGFDEMNILGGASTGGGGGITNPSFDLTNLDDIKVPKWIEWIAKNKNVVLGILKTIAAIVGAIKLIKLINDFKNLIGTVLDFNSKLKLLKAGGIALAITGFVLMAKNIIDLILNWEKLDEKQRLAKVAMAALGAAAIALGYAIAAGLSAATLGVGALIAGLALLITTITAVIVKSINEEQAIKSVADAQRDLKTAQDQLKTSNDEYVEAVDRLTEAQNALKEAQDRTGISGAELYKLVKEGTLDYKNMTDQQKEVYKAYLNTINAEEKMKEASNNLSKAKQEEKMASWENKLAVANEKKQYDEYRDAVVDAYNKGELKASEARELIEKEMVKIDEKSQKTFLENVPSRIKSSLNPDRYRSDANRLTNFFNGIFSGLNTTFGISFRVNGGGAGSKFAKGGIIQYSLPKLAPGGIINQPGRGVPLGSAIGGERGAEGVIPLTDSQQMMLLGEAIGKYITVNASITNTMNGRVISRELQRVQNESDFAYNR